jgi:conjugal transfer pilus assembly protein TraB
LSTLVERMSPRARQWATIGAISAVAVGVLWTVFAMGSGDSPQRSAARPPGRSQADQRGPDGAWRQVREEEAWVGQAGKKLAQYESERDDQRRINRERKEAEDA